MLLSVKGKRCLCPIHSQCSAGQWLQGRGMGRTFVMLLMVNQQSHTVTSKCEHFNKISCVEKTIFVQSAQRWKWGASTKKHPTDRHAVCLNWKRTDVSVNPETHRINVFHCRLWVKKHPFGKIWKQFCIVLLQFNHFPYIIQIWENRCEIIFYMYFITFLYLSTCVSAVYNIFLCNNACKYCLTTGTEHHFWLEYDLKDCQGKTLDDSVEYLQMHMSTKNTR